MSVNVHPDLPIELAQNPNVEKFAAVDGAAFIFARMPADQNVRAQLDEIYADHDLEFWTARHASTVDSKLDVEISDDYDMLFIYK